MGKIREIKEKNFSQELFQDVYGAEWSRESCEELLEKLRNIIAEKGKIYGYFEHERLSGFCAIGKRRFGAQKQYVELAVFQVAKEGKERDTQKVLWDTACSVAASFRAKKLYIPGKVSGDMQLFFKSMGARRAEEHSDMCEKAGEHPDMCEKAEEHPKMCEEIEEHPSICGEAAMQADSPLECDTGLRQSSNMTLGMCLGMCFGIPVGLLLFQNVGIGMCLGMVVGMGIGMASGKNKDS